MSRLSGGLPDIKSRPLFVTSTDRILLYVFVLVWDGIPCHVYDSLWLSSPMWSACPVNRVKSLCVISAFTLSVFFEVDQYLLCEFIPLAVSISLPCFLVIRHTTFITVYSIKFWIFTLT